MSTRNKLADAISESFTPYEILNYIVPGLVVGLNAYLVEFFRIRVFAGPPPEATTEPAIEPTSADTVLATERFVLDLLDGFLGSSSNSWAAVLIAAVFLSVVFYTFGHLISSFSYLVFERGLLEGGPLFFVRHILLARLDEDPDTSLEARGPDEARRAISSGFLFWGLLLFYSWSLVFLRAPLWELLVLLMPFSLGPLLATWALVAAWGFSVVGTVLFLAALVGLRWIPPERAAGHWAVRAFTWFPRHLRHRILRLGIEPFTQAIQDEYRRGFRDRFGLGVSAAGADAYWLSYLYLREKHPESISMLPRLLRMTTFSRNLAGAFTVSVLGTYAWLVFLTWIGAPPDPLELVLPILWFVGGCLMFMRYIHQYFGLQLKFVFQAMVMTSLVSESEAREKAEEAARKRAETTDAGDDEPRPIRVDVRFLDQAVNPANPETGADSG